MSYYDNILMMHLQVGRWSPPAHDCRRISARRPTRSEAERRWELFRK